MRILIGGDGSPAALAAVDLVAATTWSPSDQIVVLRATSPRTVSRLEWFADAGADAVRDEAERAIERDLDGLLEVIGRLAHTRADLEIVTAFGSAPTVLAAASRDLRPDVLLVGAAIRPRISAALHSCVAREVLERAASAVLVARTARLERALLVADQGAASSRAEDLLARLPVAAGATVRVLGVLADPGRSRRRGEEHLPLTRRSSAADAAAARLRSAGLDARPVVRSGDLAATIVDEARTWGADLVALGSGATGVTGSRRLRRRLLADTSASLLAVPEPAPLEAVGHSRGSVGATAFAGRLHS